VTQAGVAPCAPARAWQVLVALAALACLAQTAAAEERPGVRPGSERAPAQWLLAIQQAALRQNYQGVIVYQRGDEVRSSRVAHLAEGSGFRERLQVLDGRRREYLRTEEQTVCLYPDVRRKVVERGGRSDAFPALGVLAPGEVLAMYRMEASAVERVAGLETQVLTLQPADRMRYGYRLWVDRVSGLLVKAQTLGEHQEVIEQVAFSEVRVGPAPDRAQLDASWDTATWQVETVQTRAADLAREGWNLGAPDGFRRVREVVRTFADAPGPTLQAVWSDGLATVSVFIEPAEADPSTAAAAPVSQARGSVSAYTLRVGPAIVTAVGEVPAATVRMMAESAVYHRR